MGQNRYGYNLKEVWFHLIDNLFIAAQAEESQEEDMMWSLNSYKCFCFCLYTIF